MSSPQPIEICFVCLGNICRSPLAEGVFQALVNSEGLAEKIFVQSAGTGEWHVGSPPDDRMQATAKHKGIHLTSIAQQFLPGDFKRFDWVIAMDRANLETLEFMCSPETAQKKLRLFRSFDPQADGEEDVPDPYFGRGDGFETVYQIVHRTCPEILDFLKTQLS